MTAPLKWRSQLCPCGFCPDGTRIEWRYSIDIRFRPRRKMTPTLKERVDLSFALGELSGAIKKEEAR